MHIQSVKTQPDRQIVWRVPSLPQTEQQQTELLDIGSSLTSLKGRLLYKVGVILFCLQCVFYSEVTFLE